MGGKPRYHVSALKIPLCCGGGKGKEGGEGRRGKNFLNPLLSLLGILPFSFGKTNYGVGCDPVLTDWRGLVGSTPFRFPFHAQTGEKTPKKPFYIRHSPTFGANSQEPRTPFCAIFALSSLGPLAEGPKHTYSLSWMHTVCHARKGPLR